MPYSLSTRQLKELGERSAELRIAIPAPPDDVDALDFARQAIDVPSRWIRSAEIQELTVSPQLGKTIDLDDLTTCLGAIVPDDGTVGTAITYQVVAIVALIRQTDRVRHRGRVQWPAKFVQGRTGGSP